MCRLLGYTELVSMFCEKATVCDDENKPCTGWALAFVFATVVAVALAIPYWCTCNTCCLQPPELSDEDWMSMHEKLFKSIEEVNKFKQFDINAAVDADASPELYCQYLKRLHTCKTSLDEMTKNRQSLPRDMAKKIQVFHRIMNLYATALMFNVHLICVE